MNVCDGKLKARIKAGDVLISGGIMDSRSPAVVEVFADAGYDMLMIDREHTSLNEETISDHIRTARCLGLPCMVRVAEDCYHELNRALDQGADGIFVPRIRSRQQVEKIVDMVRYRPLGSRGLAGSSCPVGKYKGWNSVVEQIETVNKNIVIGIQIETVEALVNLDDILCVQGVDVAVVGNDDLSMGMGIPGQWESPEYIAAIERIIEACNRHNVLPGIAVGDAQKALFWQAKGMKLFWHACDIYLLHKICSQEVAAVRQGLKK
ncbi:MAG: aldolase/citrate lyase family protein [bacterium]